MSRNSSINELRDFEFVTNLLALELTLSDPEGLDFRIEGGGGIPSLAAAPSGPEMRPSVSANASSIVRFS